ncbi:16787_t:CDS:2, partial [Gigaspora margarita]
MNFRYLVNNISTTALIEADLDEIMEVQYPGEDYTCLNNAEFEEIINTTTNELSEDEVDINNTN